MKKKIEIQNYFKDYRNRIDEILNTVQIEKLVETIELIISTFKTGNTLYVCGNGGSAATATHMQADFSFFTRYFTKFRPKVRALTDNAAMMTAVGNDTSFDDIFVEQLKGHFQSGDILICISASGNSENVLRAASYANENGGTSIGFVGFEGGKLLNTASISLFTPNPKGDYGPIEDVHMIFNHLIVNYLSKDVDFLAIPEKTN
jgi:D-sedoheptulose 7-phosphate isomerase